MNSYLVNYLNRKVIFSDTKKTFKYQKKKMFKKKKTKNHMSNNTEMIVSKVLSCQKLSR